MKILSKGLTTRFFLAAALSTSFASFSYGMIPNLALPSETGDLRVSSSEVVLDEPKLPHEILAKYNMSNVETADAACQKVAAYFLQRRESLANEIAGLKIAGLSISELEKNYEDALNSVNSLLYPESDEIRITENFKLKEGVDLPEDHSIFETQCEEGRIKKRLFDFACSEKESLEEQAIDANKMYLFFGRAIDPLNALLTLKDLIITKEMQMPDDSENRRHGYYCDYHWLKEAPALAFMARVRIDKNTGRNIIFLDTSPKKNIFKWVPKYEEINVFLEDITNTINNQVWKLINGLKIFHLFQKKF